MLMQSWTAANLFTAARRASTILPAASWPLQVSLASARAPELASQAAPCLPDFRELTAGSASSNSLACWSHRAACRWSASRKRPLLLL